MFSSGALLQTDRRYQDSAALAGLRPAGLSQQATQTAKDALTWDTDRPVTPESIKPFQHYARQPPGKITRHHGAARDDVPKDTVFGCKTKASSESAAECMQMHPESEIGRWKLEQSETIYSSVRKEPLGHTLSRGYQMPEGLGTTKPCGRPLHVRAQETANSTQTIIFPSTSADDDLQTHRMYVQSHRSFGPGEQLVRDYDWAKASIDPQTHRFGRTDSQGPHSSVRQIMQPDLDEGIKAQQQPVVSDIYDRHKATLGDTLGRPKVLGAGPGSRLPSDHVFGKPSAREQEPCVCELIRGPANNQQLVDPGLGKSLTAWRDHTDTAGRVFGLPSVRTDVRLPSTRSVASTFNYGNEPTAQQLLSPPMCVNLGVKEEHLLQHRSRHELQELLTEAGISMEEQEFDLIFDSASAADREEAVGCSLEQLLKARQQYLQGCAGLV